MGTYEGTSWRLVIWKTLLIRPVTPSFLQSATQCDFGVRIDDHSVTHTEDSDTSDSEYYLLDAPICDTDDSDGT